MGSACQDICLHEEDRCCCSLSTAIDAELRVTAPQTRRVGFRRCMSHSPYARMHAAALRQVNGSRSDVWRRTTI